METALSAISTALTHVFAQAGLGETGRVFFTHDAQDSFDLLVPWLVCSAWMYMIRGGNHASQDVDLCLSGSLVTSAQERASLFYDCLDRTRHLEPLLLWDGSEAEAASTRTQLAMFPEEQLDRLLPGSSSPSLRLGDYINKRLVLDNLCTLKRLLPPSVHVFVQTELAREPPARHTRVIRVEEIRQVVSHFSPGSGLGAPLRAGPEVPHRHVSSFLAVGPEVDVFYFPGAAVAVPEIPRGETRRFLLRLQWIKQAAVQPWFQHTLDFTGNAAIFVYVDLFEILP